MRKAPILIYAALVAVSAAATDNGPSAEHFRTRPAVSGVIQNAWGGDAVFDPVQAGRAAAGDMCEVNIPWSFP